MAKFLRPETLFGNKFESYLNQKNVKNKSKEVKNPEWVDDYIIKKDFKERRKEK